MPEKHGKFTSSNLEKCGWKQSKVDQSVFTKDDILLVVYVDDAILIPPNQTKIAAESTPFKRIMC